VRDSEKDYGLSIGIWKREEILVGQRGVGGGGVEWQSEGPVKSAVDPGKGPPRFPVEINLLKRKGRRVPIGGK